MEDHRQHEIGQRGRLAYIEFHLFEFLFCSNYECSSIEIASFGPDPGAEQGIAAATTSSAKFKPYASPSLRHHSSSMFIHVQHAELLQE